MAGELPFGWAPSGELTAYTPTLRERVSDWLRPVLFSDDRAGQEKANRLTNWAETMIPPFGFATQMYDTGRAGGEGDYLTAGTLGAMAFLPGGSKKGIRAYHGSPHSFDKFDMSKIGTGQGAQTYGHGLYFAENEGVAIGYRDTLAPAPSAAQEAAQRGLDAHGGDANAAADEIANMIKDGNLLPETIDHYKSVEAILRGEASAKPGSMYEVNIDADPNAFLDWNKPLSEQPQIMEKLPPELRAKIEERAAVQGAPTGANAYAWVTPRKDGVVPPWDMASTSQALKEAGIPGIKYLDAGSRYTPANLPNNPIANEARQFLDAAQGDGEKALQLFRDSNPVDRWAGSERDEITKVIKSAAKPVTRNYVVFDDNLISIVRKYGIAGASAMLGYNLLESVNPAQADELKRIEAGK